MDSLDENNVYRIQAGRMLDEEEKVKDVIGIGLQHLSEGAKNPLREFNNAFQSLQRRRRMKPVSVLAEEHLNRPTTPSSHSLPPHPVPQATEPSDSPTLPAPSSNSGIDLMAQQASESEVEVDDANADLGEIKAPSELEGILDDLVDGGNVEPTLSTLTEDDVALDMDEVEVEVDDDSDDSEWETDVDEESNGEGDSVE
jgi:hypothetical protein